MGFDMSKHQSGLGLQNMNHRAKMIGATLTLRSEIKKGTTLLLDYKKSTDES